MLPLFAQATPTTIPEFTEALTCGLQQHGVTPRRIEGQGAAFPDFDLLRVDLTESQMTRELRPPPVSATTGDVVGIAHFELLGAPLYFEKAPLELHLIAEGVKARLTMNDGRGCLVPESAAAGNVSVQIARAALEALLHSIAVEVAAKQGFEVRKTRLSLTQDGPLAVSFRAEVTAKVFVMSAMLALTGRLMIDDELNARISGLALGGDGMILKLAGGYARPYLDRWEGRVFPLLAFTFGGLKLRNVELTAGDNVLVRAQFASA